MLGFNSIGAKLLSIFGGAMACFALVSILSYQDTTQFIASSEWVQHTYEVREELRNIISQIKDAETGQRGYIITGEDRYLEPYHNGVKGVKEQIEKVRKLVQDNPEQITRLDHLSPFVDEKLTEMAQTIDLRKNKGFEEAYKVVITDKGKRAMDEIRKTLGEMQDKEKELLKVRNAENMAKAERTKLTIIYGIIACLLILIAAAVFITRHIAAPLRRIAELANQIAVGDTSITVPEDKRSDEIGVLIRAFRSLFLYFQDKGHTLQELSRKNLKVKVTLASDKDLIGNSLTLLVNSFRSVVTEMVEGSNTLSNASSEISAVVAQVASGASETAVAISQTTATVEEVRQTAHISTQNAKGVSDHAKQAADVSESGKASVDASIQGMQQIQQRMLLMTENIMRLSEQSQTIGDIIATVNDLAEQSNLLAVNAAIEAAKAGEQGKGFVVVAQEVKILAEQSKQATGQIRVILNDIQKATSAAVMAAEQSNKAVESGMKQVQESGKSIVVLGDKVTLSAAAAMQIVASSEQQVQGVAQVATAMENIKIASTQNVEGTKQIELAVRNLNSMGQRMSSLVGQFVT